MPNSSHISLEVLERLPLPYRLLARFSAYVRVEELLALPERATNSTNHRYHRTETEAGGEEMLTLLWSAFPGVARDVTIPRSLFEEHLDYWLRDVSPVIYARPEEDGLFYYRGACIRYKWYAQEVAVATRSAAEILTLR